MIQRKWPEWSEWELEFSPHLLKRMADRRFMEIDVRAMLGRASCVKRDHEPERWVVETRHRRKPWYVIVESDAEAELLVVITA